jgi:hypothetical protein
VVAPVPLHTSQNLWPIFLTAMVFSRVVAVMLFSLVVASAPLHTPQNLWPIFLTHLMEVLHSGNSVTRASGLEALDRTLTGEVGQT